PSVVRISNWRNSIFPKVTVLKLLATPIGYVEGWVGHDVVNLKVFMLIAVEGVAQLNPGINAPDSQVHLCQLVGGWVGFLPIHCDVSNLSTMCFNELFTLYKHTT